MLGGKKERMSALMELTVYQEKQTTGRSQDQYPTPCNFKYSEQKHRAYLRKIHISEEIVFTMCFGV